MSIWVELRKAAIQHWPDVVSTSLLGDVTYRTNKFGQLVGYFPDWVLDRADEHGLYPIEADYKRGVYSFKLIRFPPIKQALGEKP